MQGRCSTFADKPVGGPILNPRLSKGDGREKTMRLDNDMESSAGGRVRHRASQSRGQPSGRIATSCDRSMPDSVLFFKVTGLATPII